MANAYSDDETDYLLVDSYSPGHSPLGRSPVSPSMRFNDYEGESDEGHSSGFSPKRSPKGEERREAGPRRLREKIPDRFDGRSPWREYWSHFQACWDLNEWTKEEAAMNLASSLRDGACKVLVPKPIDREGRGRGLTIRELVARLERRYGPGELAESYLTELKQRRRHPKETIQELGENIRELVMQAYPEATVTFAERLAVVHFKDALREAETRAAVHRAKPATLDDAILAALESESFVRAESQRERPRHLRTVQKNVQFDERGLLQDRITRLEESQQELVQLVKEMTLNQAAQSQASRCYGCNRVGHFRRNCPYHEQRSAWEPQLGQRRAPPHQRWANEQSVVPHQQQGNQRSVPPHQPEGNDYRSIQRPGERPERR